VYRKTSRKYNADAPMLQESGEEEEDETEDGKYRRDNPKPHRNLALRPAKRLKMVVDRSGQEHLLPAKLFARNLDNYRKRLENKDRAEERQEKRRIGKHRHNAKRDSERHGPGVSHKKSRGIDIEPEECEEGAEDHRVHCRKIESAKRK